MPCAGLAERPGSGFFLKILKSLSDVKLSNIRNGLAFLTDNSECHSGFNLHWSKLFRIQRKFETRVTSSLSLGRFPCAYKRPAEDLKEQTVLKNRPSVERTDRLDSGGTIAARGYAASPSEAPV